MDTKLSIVGRKFFFLLLTVWFMRLVLKTLLI